MVTKDIKVYGTLVNHTVDSSIGDNNHNDKLAYARQLYDDKFGETTKVNNFQDVINKRVKNITSDGNKTFIEGDLYINGQKVNLADILARLEALEASVLWKANGEYLEPSTSVNKVKGAGFFDTTIN